MRKIWIVDAFTDQPYKGNPAGVMIVEDFPEDMQEIAAELNLSETAFVKPLGPNHFHLKWLTPKVEVKLCGHATLATAHILFQEKIADGCEIKFDSLSGELLVVREGDGLVLNFPLQKTSDSLEVAPFIEALQIDSIEEVLQAFDDVIVVLKSEEDLRLIAPDFEKLKQVDARGIIVTAPSNSYDFVSRFFAPRVGVNEDPVTGSAHCKLTDYWSRRLSKNDLNAYQLSQRGGRINVRLQGDRVLLKGNAMTIMEGKWFVSGVKK